MDEQPLRARAAALIAAAERRTPGERDDLVAALQRWCWPGGAADRTVPAARAWVRRWGPRRVDSLVIECTCAQGRCDLCN